VGPVGGSQMNEPAYPSGSILDPNFKYEPSAKTDVQATWRKHGWVPPSEQKKNEMSRVQDQVHERAGDQEKT
jgi:hypothetical protein